ncbi:uncharacterized protein CMU_030080 [Cryptosporidium muris RN66]|uniref:Uncharacterized protein n=1 Tax=Cryptosporidium muris (strain RN66) TaxID=441375 RepID=B6AI91_CRYMR|nr:uncharacterized protein CMU_030080 [Cryptosporidium muris RN66]EEA07932.1 hypothetical protein CMU_030080 [Cryptosporidium muris RN66]|eukprot:XP_002142281.1 hypothetical protein [Cryptosporidium muris RN66]
MLEESKLYIVTDDTNQYLIHNILLKLDPTISSRDFPILMSIDTKYYKANINVENIPIDKFEPEKVKEMDALLIIVSKTIYLSTLLTKLKLYKDYDITKLCCITSLINPEISYEIKSQCIDSSIELILISSKDSNCQYVYNLESGINRIVESITCTMWSNLQLKKHNINSDNYLEEDPEEGDSEEIYDLSQFDSLMYKITDLRSKCHNLSDDERRRNATDIVLELIKQFNINNINVN